MYKIAMKTSAQPAELALPGDWARAVVLEGSGLEGAQMTGATVTCAPWGGVYLQRV